MDGQGGRGRSSALGALLVQKRNTSVRTKVLITVFIHAIGSLSDDASHGLLRRRPARALRRGACPAAQERVLNVFNWNDYIDPYMVQRFTRETGIRVRYDIFDSLETLEGRLSKMS